jgi:hypothetical protein
MSILHVGHIQAAIEKRFKGLIDLSDVPDANKGDCFLTRGLSAFVIAALSGADDAVAAQSVLDGSRDNGIDALFFDPTERVCYLVQSKWIKTGNGSVDLGSALKFKQGVHDFFQGSLDKFGPKMQKLRPQIEDVLGDSRNTFVLVVAYTGQQPLSSEVQPPLEELVAALNDTSELVSLRVLPQADLHGTVAQRAIGEAVNLQVMLKNWGSFREPYTAYYGQVDLKDIATWGKFGQFLYARNIRGFKGSTDVNEGIASTIKTNPQNFWYFNNGITIVASKITPQPLGSGTQDSRVFECEGASVINGAQTVGSIVSALNTPIPGLDKARVLVRIISLEGVPADFAIELTKAANTQNRIESKDFVAQDPQQHRLQTELLLGHNKRYVYRSGDAAPPPSDGFTFEDGAVALACAHEDISHCVQAKREVGKLWEDITKSPYTILYNSRTSSVRMWHAVEIMRAVESELKKFQGTLDGKAKLIATHGNRFVLHSVFRSIPDPAEVAVEKVGDVAASAVQENLAKLILVTTNYYETSYPSNLFKNLSKCKILAKEMARTATN